LRHSRLPGHPATEQYDDTSPGPSHPGALYFDGTDVGADHVHRVADNNDSNDDNNDRSAVILDCHHNHHPATIDHDNHHREHDNHHREHDNHGGAGPRRIRAGGGSAF